MILRQRRLMERPPFTIHKDVHEMLIPNIYKMFFRHGAEIVK